MTVHSCAGSHLILELFACDPRVLAQPVPVQDALTSAASLLRAGILQGHFHHFGAGGGVTGVLLLQESHASIHTWPEHGYAAIDIFMCGQPQLQPAIELLTAAFNARHSSVQILQRGQALMDSRHAG